MLLHDGVSESYIERVRYVFLALSVLFMGIMLLVIVQGEAVSVLPLFTNSMGLVVQTGVTVLFTVLVFRKHASLNSLEDV